jgi:hypothetical protein
MTLPRNIFSKVYKEIRRLDTLVRTEAKSIERIIEEHECNERYSKSINGA